MVDNIRKPTFHEPPKTYAKNQLYEPIKFYKLVRQEGEDGALEQRVREQLIQNSGKNSVKKSNPLERGVFLDKIEDQYGSLKNHRETVSKFYVQHATEAFRKQRKLIQHTESLSKGAQTRVTLVPVDEGNPLLPTSGLNSPQTEQSETDGPNQLEKKKTSAKKHFEMIKLKTEILKTKQVEDHKKKVERNEKNWKRIKDLETQVQ